MSGISYSLFHTRHYVLNRYFTPLFSSHSVSPPATGAPTGNHCRDRATPLFPGRQHAHRRPATAHHPLVPWVQTVIPSDIAAEVECQASDKALRYDALP